MVLKRCLLGILLCIPITASVGADKKNQSSRRSLASIDIPIVPAYETIVDRVSADSILAHLQKLESLGVKTPGTQALDDTRDWLHAKYASYGYPNITTHDFDYQIHTLQNIVVTKTGTVAPDKHLIIDGHYDTIVGPGVNDNGSGVAAILEAARVLADVDCDVSIRFIHFSGEEEGLIGSTAYVDEVVVPQDMDILLVLNIDEIGGIAGMANHTVTCERDEGWPTGNNAASAAYTDSLAALTELYTSLNTQIAHAWGSDYLPFEDAGYIITGFYETNESPYPHTPDDRLVNMDPDYVTEIARATVAAALHFALADADPTPVTHPPTTTPTTCRLHPPYPNPFNAATSLLFDMPESGHLRLVVYDEAGREVQTLVDGWKPEGTHRVTFSGAGLTSGLYIAVMETRTFRATQRLLLVK
jgi:hypothetical protein